MSEDQQPTHLLGTWPRIYLHGILAFAVVSGLAYLVSRLVPIFLPLGSPTLAIVLSVLAIFVLPPLVGSIILYGVFPLLGRHASWSRLAVWDDRLFREVSQAKERARMVVINWPSSEVRTMGVHTSTIHDGEHPLAVVYVPTAPQTRYGYIRIVRMEDVEFTDWTWQQWQLYQWTFGSVSPGKLNA